MKTVTCKKCGITGFSWHQRHDGRWVLIDQQSSNEHQCSVGQEVKTVNCKYCNAQDLFWSKERMEDGSTRNVLTESFGLPHGCDEYKAHREAEYNRIKQEKKDRYANEKKRLSDLVAQKSLTQKECDVRLYRFRKALWPRMYSKRV